jgi:hypothetical protein
LRSLSRRIPALPGSYADFPQLALHEDALASTPARDWRIKSFRLQKQAQVSRVNFQAQYQAFVRSAVEAAQLSSHRARIGPAFWNLSLVGGLSL